MKRAPVDIWLSLATAPLLLGYLGARSVGDWLIEIGKNSEEIFRGERLPVIDHPSPPSEYEE